MATRKLNRRQADYVLAGSMGLVLGLALAFFVFAMPQDLFESIVNATGLPSVLSAAEPPLGQTARMIMAALAGGFAALLVGVLFLFIDWPAEKKQVPARPAFSAAELDSLFGSSETGEGAPLRSPAVIFEEAPLPSRPEPIPVLELEDVIEVAPVETPAPVKEEPIFLDFSAFRATPIQPANDEPPLDLDALSIIEAPSPAPIAPVVKPMPIPAPVTIPAEESIETLMQRLEAGLDRREKEGKREADAPTPTLAGSGLRSTLDELRNMAVRR